MAAQTLCPDVSCATNSQFVEENFQNYKPLYQVRCSLRVSPRLPVQVETCLPDATTAGIPSVQSVLNQNGGSNSHNSSNVNSNSNSTNNNNNNNTKCNNNNGTTNGSQ
uniref:Uncharacterized protein n=1 Tax=Anopheles stephensi TaxID=30069 RepID=A0A182Y115_ANOST